MHDEYESIAPLYDPVTALALWAVRRRIAALLAGFGAARVLDLCCGTGRQFLTLPPCVARAVGVDASAAMLAVARRACPPWVRLLRADAAHLPLAEASFDAVLISFALHEKPHETRLAMLAEALRVAGSRGRVLITDYALPQSVSARMAGAVAHGVERLAGGEHYRLYRDYMVRGGTTGVLLTAGHMARRLAWPGWGAIGVYEVRAGACPQLRAQRL